jgi:transcription initiation factor TFIIIB Brf1 subunit/transcription initiation factor TFIIB
LFHHDRTYREHLDFVEIDRICQKLNTPRWIKIEAARLSVKVLDLGAKMRPLARTTIMTAVVFAAYRIHNVAIDIGQICQTPSWKKEVLRAYRKLHELEIVSPTVIRPQQCVDPIILALKEEFAARGISRAEVERVTRLHDKAVAKLRTWRKLCEGRSPFVSAALAIYESAKECGIDAPIRRVAKAAKVSPESISRLHGVLAPLQSVP